MIDKMMCKKLKTLSRPLPFPGLTKMVIKHIQTTPTSWTNHFKLLEIALHCIHLNWVTSLGTNVSTEEFRMCSEYVYTVCLLPVWVHYESVWYP